MLYTAFMACESVYLYGINKFVGNSQKQKHLIHFVRATYRFSDIWCIELVCPSSHVYYIMFFFFTRFFLWSC